MTETRKNEYMIRFDGETVSFPEICPICGDYATTKSTVLTAVEETRNGLSRDVPRWSLKAPVGGISPAHWRGFRPASAAVRKLQVNTCEEHSYSADERGRARSFFIVTNGLSLLALIFLGLQVGFLVIQGLPVAIWQYILLALAAGVAVISYKALSPSDLEKAIRIVSYNKEGSSFIVKIANDRYAREFLRRNPHSAELLEAER